MDDENWLVLTDDEKTILQNAIDDVKQVKARLFDEIGTVRIFNDAIQHLEGDFDEIITKLERLIYESDAKQGKEE